MYCITKSEEELFSDIECFSGLFISIQQALLHLAELRRRLIELESGSLKDLSGICSDFEGMIAAIKAMRDQIGLCDPRHFPALAFVEFSQALYFVLRRVRRSLPPMYGDDPISGVSDKLEEIKNLCRPEKRPENITAEEFREGVDKSFAGMINFACKIASSIRSYSEERGITRNPTAAETALSRVEATVDDTNAVVHRFDNRDRRHRDDAGKGCQLGFVAKKKCGELWRDCCENPHWFGTSAKGKRITKKMAYEYLLRSKRLPAAVGCLKDFLRCIDSARKL